MPSSRILIVDDEHLARQKLRRFVESRPEGFELREAANGLQALEAIEEFRPDILFLDIEMPELSGLQVIQQLEKRPFRVIFQTAFDEFAVSAFEENACDYLLKPFTEARFNQALDRALSELDHEKKLSQLDGRLRAGRVYLEKIAATRGSKRILLDSKELFCFISRDHYTCVYTAQGESIVDLSIESLEERLDPARFARLHRNNIVRWDAIASVLPGENLRVELQNGEILPVSRSNRKNVLQRFS